jgi:hypothetical protein
MPNPCRQALCPGSLMFAVGFPLGPPNVYHLASCSGSLPSEGFRVGCCASSPVVIYSDLSDCQSTFLVLCQGPQPWSAILSTCSVNSHRPWSCHPPGSYRPHRLVVTAALLHHFRRFVVTVISTLTALLPRLCLRLSSQLSFPQTTLPHRRLSDRQCCIWISPVLVCSLVIWNIGLLLVKPGFLFI